MGGLTVIKLIRPKIIITSVVVESPSLGWYILQALVLPDGMDLDNLFLCKKDETFVN